MDVTLFGYLGLAPDAARAAVLDIAAQCHRFRGALGLLWHNDELLRTARERALVLVAGRRGRAARVTRAHRPRRATSRWAWLRSAYATPAARPVRRTCEYGRSCPPNARK